MRADGRAKRQDESAGKGAIPREGFMRSLNIGVLAGLTLLLIPAGPVAAQTAVALSGQNQANSSNLV